MSYREWEYLRLTNPKEFVKQYKQFMYNENNTMNCQCCPENENFDSGSDFRKPCGHFKCWVDVHCANR